MLDTQVVLDQIRKHTLSSNLLLRNTGQALHAVTSGLRTACLLDIPLSDGACISLLSELRTLCSLYEGVCFLREETCDQTFLISAELLKQRLEHPADDPVWMSARNGTFTLLPSAPTLVKRAAEDICSRLSLPLPRLLGLPPLEPSSLVALAGFLLEYPAVYVPSDALHFDNVTAHVWRVILCGPNEHTLLQFSYPSSLPSVPSLDIKILTSSLSRKFQNRLRGTCTEWTEIKVVHETKTEPRITL